MPSSYSTSLRFEMQFTGENINLWGAKLSNTLARIDDAIAGYVAVPLTADASLTSSTNNTTADQARRAYLKFTGTGSYTVTIPSVSKVYQLWNALTGTATVTTGSGTTVALVSGEIVTVVCDGTNVKRVAAQDMGAVRLRNLADPTSAQDAATKAYADALAFTANAGILPGQVANSGKWLRTISEVASWQPITAADLTDYETAIKGLQVALAVAL